MGLSSTSHMIFDAEAAKALSELQKLAAAERQLKRDIREAADESVKGSKAAEVAMSMLSKELAGGQMQAKRLREELRMTGSTAQTSGQMVATGSNQAAVAIRNVGLSAGQSRMNMNQLTFAADDFLTVLQMPGMGLIPALRASANNLSYVLMAIHPLAALLPVLGTSALTLGANFFKAADGQKELGKQTDDTLKKLQEELAVMRAIGQETETREEFERLGKLKPLREQQQDLQNQRRTAIARQAELPRLIDESKAMAQFDESGMAKARQFALEKELEKLRPTIANIKREEQKVGQEINLIQEAADERAKIRKAEEDKQRREKIAKNLREALSPYTGHATRFAAQALTEGQSPATVEASLRDLLKGQISPEQQPAMEDYIREVIQGGQGAAIGMQLAKKTISPDEKRRQFMDVEMGRINLERMQLSGKPGRGRREKELDEQAKALAVERQQLDLKMMQEAQRPTEQKLDTANALMQRLIDATEAQNATVTPSRQPRPVARNP